MKMRWKTRHNEEESGRPSSIIKRFFPGKMGMMKCKKKVCNFEAIDGLDSQRAMDESSY